MQAATAPRHVLVAGGGIGGVCAADALVHAGYCVTLVHDDARPATALAALVNPFTGPRASPAWRYREALAALGGFLTRAKGVLNPGLFRPARDAKQAAAFRARAAEHPGALAWQDASPFAFVAAPLGGLDVRVGGVWTAPGSTVHYHIDRLVSAGMARVRGTVLDAEASAHACRVRVLRRSASSPSVLYADAAVLALGPGLARVVPGLAPHLHAVKGEVFGCTHPRGGALPALAAGGYLVPGVLQTVTLGGTYDHGWTDLVPDPARGEVLRQALLPFVPDLGPLGAWAQAGLRVQRPRLRVPLLEPLDPGGRVWALGGFGAKGLLHAPYVASLLPAALRDSSSVPAELRL